MNRAERLALAIAATIKDMGDNGAPSGIIFAGLQGQCTFSEYNSIINKLIELKLIRRKFHVLYWIGDRQQEG